MVRLDRSAVVLFMAVTAAADASAQTTLDEGTFRILENGREVATETFSIRQTGSGAGAVIIASGRISYREGPRQELRSVLELSGDALRPAGYDVRITGQDSMHIAARSAGGRISARIITSGGERAREYLVSEGALVADESVAHHHYFIARAVPGEEQVRIPVIVPLEGRQLWATVTAGAEQSIQIAGSAIPARPLTIQIEGNGERRVWVDANNRVMKLEVPARSLVAERTALPQ